MREFFKILLVGSLSSVMYYYAVPRDILLAQIIAWCCLLYSMFAAIILVCNPRIYVETMRAFTKCFWWTRFVNYGFIALNIYNTYGSALGYIYFILFAFFESLFIIAKLSAR